MARRLRYHSPSSTYHVMLRGNDGQSIFLSDRDKARMCLYIQQGVERFFHSIEAFCFMTNHIHLAVRVSEIPLSQIIHHLSFRYANYFNRSYNKTGHLFQGRYKSILVDDTTYLKELVRYIHLNPIRAGIVHDPKHYQWSSHNVYLGLDEIVWLSQDRVMKKFYTIDNSVIRNYEHYILQGIGLKEKYDFEIGFENGIIGDTEFIDETLETFIIASPKKIRTVELPDMVDKVCELYHLTPEVLCKSGKQPIPSQARSMLSLLVREIDYISLESLSQFLQRDSSSLTKGANRLEIKSKEDPEIEKQIEELRNWLTIE